MEDIQTISDQEIHIHTHTSNDGIIHLDIPVGIANQDIDLKISYSVTKPIQKTPNVDHFLGSFSSSDTKNHILVEEETEFGRAVIKKLANQSVEL